MWRLDRWFEDFRCVFSSLQDKVQRALLGRGLCTFEFIPHIAVHAGDVVVEIRHCEMHLSSEVHFTLLGLIETLLSNANNTPILRIGGWHVKASFDRD